MTTKISSIVIILIIISQSMNAIDDVVKSKRLDNLTNRVNKIEAQLGQLN